MHIEISKKEFLEEPFYLNSEQTILNVLHKKGAPIVGTLFKEIDKENYFCQQFTCPARMDVKIFLFFKRKKKGTHSDSP